ncbi:MAG: hypothetical protein J7623_19625 [Chitinophaga sp.]|uniref:hypothetical protein n=1 Tax=Chitinophaga sp. TaxID=1869181 RepID=UPI001B2B062E|nr:hypothetical protein [Chitinophaga sp.]MBO9730859.1 hypothetical protein [Chitinophaga sp.]
MKKSIRFLLSSLVILSACQKDNSNQTPTPPQKKDKHPVQFNVTGFSSSIADFSNGRNSQHAKIAGDSLPAYVHYLAYNVYEASNLRFIKTIYQTQTAAGANFGKITDTLATGSYVVSITATQDSILPNPDGYFGGMANPTNIPDGFAATQPGTDVFNKRMTISVDSGLVNQNVVLDRIVSKLKLVIEDTIPANAKLIGFYPTKYPKVQYSDLPAFYQYREGTITVGWNGNNTYGYYYVPIADTGKRTNFSMETLVLNTTSQQISVRILCLGPNNIVIADKTVNDITLENNKITILRGRLFSTSGGSGGVDVGVDGRWKADSIVVGL